MAYSESAGSPKLRVEQDSATASLTLARAAVAELFAAPAVDGGLRATALSAPLAPVDALFSANSLAATVLWDPAAGYSLSGLGVTEEIVCSDLADKKKQALALFERLQCFGDHRAPLPRLIGGLSFAKGSASSSEWSAFGDGVFVLPRWTYLRDQTHAWLIVSLRDAEANKGSLALSKVQEELDAIWAALLWRKLASADPQSLTQVSHLGMERWRAQVNAIRQQIGSGFVEKVVAARRSEVELAKDVDVLALLANLEQRFPECTRFALWRDADVFLGVSPEKLVSRYGREVSSEALAGSVPKGQEQQLLSSDKERLEHQLVVDAVSQALSRYCDELRVASAPRIVELPNLLHMQTPIEGHMAQDTHVLDLVAMLHPTPAVAGVPREDAVSWIQQHEEQARGWYSAPFGWIDSDGDGEFLVALRSGLVRQNKVWVYAGAGIMRDSDPQAEYNETALKMQALLGAFDGAH